MVGFPVLGWCVTVFGLETWCFSGDRDFVPSSEQWFRPEGKREEEVRKSAAPLLVRGGATPVSGGVRLWWCFAGVSFPAMVRNNGRSGEDGSAGFHGGERGKGVWRCGSLMDSEERKATDGRRGEGKRGDGGRLERSQI
ncbi:hypothetical protein HAX54_021820 [Datura stramonium]|uniref:Secreted protein n=1 Tax=Datura stramonium TaxID=4076 RepID=A0ABS8S616_DATST|nr:hypothetical protein [Datura stramonium]